MPLEIYPIDLGKPCKGSEIIEKLKDAATEAGMEIGIHKKNNDAPELAFVSIYKKTLFGPLNGPIITKMCIHSDREYDDFHIRGYFLGQKSDVEKYAKALIKQFS